ncbi:50S ribosomal protein L10 [Thalassospira mesophila]|uniref:Large ribosomal subunit protein uL10 n=1 Tax=Thalassospira mesophila TaxID=1293891 RepID=A0A1Y2KUR9_9PROT|nr:50S ribosomal protein L10 [Thalassospira mesophila]OSQ35346.1 50S ribosomal protein L10 [Thalassospira mesophila]
MNRDEKQQFVAEMREVFEAAEGVIITQYKGLTVAEITALRAQMRQAGAGFKVTKNRLTRLALEGTKFANLAEYFTGPTAIAYSADPAAAAKVAATFAKANEKLVLVAGGLGELVLDERGVKALAELPSLDELRAKLVGMIQTPAQRIATLTSKPAAQIAQVLKAYAEKGEAA